MPYNPQAHLPSHPHHQHPKAAPRRRIVERAPRLHARRLRRDKVRLLGRILVRLGARDVGEDPGLGDGIKGELEGEGGFGGGEVDDLEGCGE